MVNDSFSKYHDSVYSRDFPDDRPNGWIQWKGTDVCIDLRCTCGAHMHFDGEFFYRFKCGHCGALYAVGPTVRLIPISDKEEAWYQDGFSYDNTPTLFDDEKEPSNGNQETGE